MMAVPAWVTYRSFSIWLNIQRYRRRIDSFARKAAVVTGIRRSSLIVDICVAFEPRSMRTETETDFRLPLPIDL